MKEGNQVTKCSVMLLAAAAMVMIAAPSMAQFKQYEPPKINDFTTLECAIVKVTDHDRRDPIYKINVNMTLNIEGQLSELRVQHFATSGATYVRSDQYTNGSIFQKPNVMEWYWLGYRGPNIMIGELSNDGQKWWYSERLLNAKSMLRHGMHLEQGMNGLHFDYEMISQCHEMSRE